VKAIVPVKLLTEQAEARFNFCIPDLPDERPDGRSVTQYAMVNQFQTLP
jgi:hypothetical protein